MILCLDKSAHVAENLRRLKINWMKRLFCLFTLAPLLGIAVFYFSTPPTSPTAAPKINPGIPKKPAAAVQTKDQEAEMLRRLEERNQKLEESMARMAKRMTPERQGQLIDQLMKDRAPRYGALFESWNLESSRADETLKIVREREAQKYEALRMLNETGYAGGAAFNESLDFEKEFSSAQLSLLLGEERSKEFARLESQMEREMQATAMKAVSAAAD